MWVPLLIWLGVGIVAIWMYGKKKHAFFKGNGINNLPPTPVFGNILESFTKKMHTFDIIDVIYKAFPNDRFVGMYELMNPVVLVRDLELMKKIGVKDFDHFTDHRSFTTDSDPFLSKSIFGLKGDKWRDMRSTLSPAFTASKLRGLIPLIQECAKNLQDYVQDNIKNNKDGKFDVDVKDLLTRYANDVIATCAFGLQINSISDKNNEFFKMGNLLTDFSSLWSFMKFFLASIIPRVESIPGFQVFSPKAINFFRGIFLGTMKQRDKNNIHRPDMLQLLMEAQKGTLKHDKNEEKDAGFATVLESNVGKSTVKRVWDDEHIVAQALLFFFAGFDTVSTGMMMLFHELALNPDIQERLRQEIDEAWELNKGKFDYDNINKMKYMDMCISETLRKWPPTGTTDRVCIKNYNMGKPNDSATEYVLPAGTALAFSMYSIHRDEKYYPDPLKFDPERFSDENKHNITPFNYLPFGFGPRNCIGSRFALAEMKILAISMLRYFSVTASPSTVTPLLLDKSELSLRLEGGHKLVFTARKNVT